MKKLSVIVFIFLTLNIYAQSPEQDPSWLLNPQESDEFDSPTLKSKWKKITGGPHWGPSIFDPNYAILSQDKLKLKADKIGQTYYTGGIESKSFDNFYGYYEVLIKLPCGKGYWPAFWLWAGDPTFPDATWYHEIDIIEVYGCQMEGCRDNGAGLHANIVGGWGNQEKVFELVKSDFPNLGQQFYKFGVEWLPDRVVWYFEDESWAYTREHIPYHAQQVLIDLQISHPGECEPNSQTISNMPDYMEVEYYRFYELQMDCSTDVIVSNNFDFANISNFGVKKSYNISNTTVNVSKTTLRATDYIELGVNFDVPANTEFNASITPCF